MQGTLHLNKQEQEGRIDFNGNLNVMTAHFKQVFGEEAEDIVEEAIDIIMKEHPKGADYFQTFDYEYPDGQRKRFWVIVDEMGKDRQNVLTALLPEDY